MDLRSAIDQAIASAAGHDDIVALLKQAEDKIPSAMPTLTTPPFVHPAWPHDDTNAKNAYYGNFLDKGWSDVNLVHMFPPFTMYYEKQPLGHGLLVHKLIVNALQAAFGQIWDKCNHDQKQVDATGASDWGGCFNIRAIAGSNSYSNHSWACAVDISPSTNGFRYDASTTLAHPVIDAFKRQGFRWGGDYHGRTDPMHFEAVTP